MPPFQFISFFRKFRVFGCQLFLFSAEEKSKSFLKFFLPIHSFHFIGALNTTAKNVRDGKIKKVEKRYICFSKKTHFIFCCGYIRLDVACDFSRSLPPFQEP